MSNTTKLTITKIHRSNKDKEGKELIGKNGRPYTRVGIKTMQYGEKWLSGFENRQNANWKEGDSVEVIVEQKGEYLNFRTISIDERVDELEKRMNNVERVAGVVKPKDEAEPLDRELDVENLPF